MKTIVYAIARNESDKVEEWFSRVKEADKVIVLVNNSTDDTATKLRNLGAEVVEKDYPCFRFDVARNDSLSLVPLDTDICVCVDIDELLEVGWREKVENFFDHDILSYKIVNNSWFYTAKIHTRFGWKWKHACHEVLEWVFDTPFRKGYIDVKAHHYPDNKPRNYLPLLELDAKENPKGGRAWHYLGREYMYQGMNEKAIDALIISLNYDNWIEQRCASMRFISRCHYRLRNITQAKLWLFKACGECYLREPYVDMAWLLAQERDWGGVKHFISIALGIDKKGIYPPESSAWGGYPKELFDTALKEIEHGHLQLR